MTLLNLAKLTTLIWIIGIIILLTLQGKTINKDRKKFKKYEIIMSIFQHLFMLHFLIIAGVEYFNDSPNEITSTLSFIISMIGIILSGIFMFKINTTDKNNKPSKLIHTEYCILIITIVAIILFISNAFYLNH